MNTEEVMQAALKLAQHQLGKNEGAKMSDDLLERLDWVSCDDTDIAALAAARIREDAANTLRLIATIRYLGGIAEKGEGRKQRDDETTEQFVLGYVKRIESELEDERKAREEEREKDGDYMRESINRYKERAEAAEAKLAAAYEECAKVCDDLQHKPEHLINAVTRGGMIYCAAAIRALKEPK